MNAKYGYIRYTTSKNGTRYRFAGARGQFSSDVATHVSAAALCPQVNHHYQPLCNSQERNMFGYFAEKLNVKNLGELLAPTLTPEQEFHAAIEQGLHEKFVQMLDEQNIDPNAKNDAGNLPIHTAAYYGRVEFLEILLTHNVDVNALCPRQNSRFIMRLLRAATKRSDMKIQAKPQRCCRRESPRPWTRWRPDQSLRLPRSAETTRRFRVLPWVPQQQTPQNNLYAAATHSAIPRGGPSRFARPKDYRPIQADGFGSSVGNEELTAKFGNKREIKVTAPPPSMMVPPAPASADSGVPEAAAAAPPAPGGNPYASATAPVAHQPPAFGGAAAPQYTPQPHYDAPAQDEEVNLSANAREIMSLEQETTKALESLSFEELSLLNERKEALKKDHAVYVEAHPEIKTLLSGFMSALLLEKPQDVVAFAAEHFSAFKPPHADLEPIVIAGPSGVGKGTLINLLLEKFPNTFGFSVSHTTRGPREGEVDGVAYHFTDKDKVLKEIEAGLFLEHAEVHGNVYGTSKRAVQDVQEKGKICILDIDIQGVQQVKKSGIRTKYLFIAPPSMEELEKRLRGRATETEDKIQLRVKNAAGELAYGQEPGVFDSILVNKVVDDSFRELVATLKQWYPTVELK
ncbi:P-loop containing nucleoside triphosphate hydrolase [Phytophthora cactorum]|nr:P-loop containing nucleoside triphosphate hydrolase [Phytophthora cactorum]